MDTKPRYTIGVVSQRTGLSVHAIRAWERRYGIVSPGRTEGGARLYSSNDILRLRLLRQATESGLSIGNLAELSLTELIALSEATGGPPEEGPREAVRGGLSALDAPILVAIEEMDAAGVQTGLRRALAYHGAREFVDVIALPLLRRVGELWEDASFCAAQEHLFSVQLRRELDDLLESLHAADDAPGLVATTLSGETHELGAMLAAIVGATEGWRVLYPGPDLPADDIALSARVTGAAVVLISVVSPLSRRSLAGKTRRLVELLPEATSLIVGGPGAAAHADAIEAEGATFLADLDALATRLRSLTSSRTGPGGSSSKIPAGAAVS